MVDFKLTIGNPKTGKSYKKDITGKEADALLGKDIGETINGDDIGFPGYEFVATGGSDYAGFPMRHGIKGAGRKMILMYRGTGFSGRDRWRKTQRGLRVKKTICGQKIYPKITQVNLKITKEGPKDLFAEEKPKEEAKEAKPEKKEAKKEKPKETKPAKKEAKAEEKPKEEAKPEPEKKEAKKEKPAAEKKPETETK